MGIKQYAERDAMKLDQAGGYYCRHVSAMTSEQLNSKGDIAAELGWRDMQIARLNEQVRALAAENANMRNAIDQTIGWQESVDAENTESVRALVDLKTPATDAIINELRVQAIQDSEDTKRMDWLVSRYVEVRNPLFYGSHALFVAQCDSEDNEEYHTTLREQIDAARIHAGEIHP